MKTVGIRNLRDSLSKYINYVKDGETVYVTDHNKIVAEIVPSSGNNNTEARLNDYIKQQSMSGKMVKATMNTRLEDTETPTAKDNDLIADIYNETREERL